MTHILISHRAAQQAARHPERSALLLGLTIFGLLWILYIPYRELYLPNGYDIPALADGLLLAPGARWQDWFTRGYAHFWDLYPEWPAHNTAFTRPAFQFVIYLAHFVLGRDWASYQLINCFAVAGTCAFAFHIAQRVLGLRTGLSLIAATLVLLSPPVLDSWLFGLAFAIEPLATLLVAGAFLAVVARRDFLCLILLFVALLTKENAVWAPFAAAITIMMRPKPDELLRRRAFTAAAMFLPIVMWLGLRCAFFGGIGGTYATEGYTPLRAFLKLIYYKLTHIHYLFMHHQSLLDWGIALLIYALLFLWALRILPETVNKFRYAMREARWPTVDEFFLVTVWAAIALAFHFALALYYERYATSFVVFAWPALVAEVERRRNTIVWCGLAVCVILSLTQSSYRLVKFAKSAQSDFASMGAALRQVPTDTRQIYVLAAGGLQAASPEYVRLVLGLPAEIVRVADIRWECRGSSDLVAFKHGIIDDVVNVTVTLPACAKLFFDGSSFNGTTVVNGRLYRNDTMSYELPDANPNKPSLLLGQRMTVHVRPKTPARFIIQHGGPSGIAWFDTP
jgi:hypothetical protein